LGGMGSFAPTALFSENYLDPPHDKFLNTPLTVSPRTRNRSGITETVVRSA